MESEALMKTPRMEESMTEEIDGGALGCYCDWGYQGGNLYGDCCECSPCCGEPWSIEEGLYCCCLWFWCWPCAQAKLFAYSVDQECAFVNHFLPSCCCECLVAPFVRSNLRGMHNIGEPGCSIGDVLTSLCLCTAPCAFCQHLRSVPRDSWDFLSPNSRFQFCIEPLTIQRPTVVVLCG